MNEVNTQFCTTKKQSDKLLSLGLKKETADMSTIGDTGSQGEYVYSFLPDEWVEGIQPRWSLHRLIALTGVYMCECIVETAYEDAINLIEDMIKNGCFNKKYLNNGQKDEQAD